MQKQFVLSFEKIEILETLDSRTCSVCGDMDGKVLPISQYEPGVTVPPFHPGCRGTTCPHYGDLDGERTARNAKGKVYYVPADITYAQWQQQFVLRQSSWSGIIGVKTSDGHVVGSLKDHFLDQAGARAVSVDEAIDALTKTLHKTDVKFNERGEPSVQYIGAAATVAYNPDIDAIITTWRTGKRLRRKYGGGGE